MIELDVPVLAGKEDPAEAAALHACFRRIRTGRLRKGDEEWILPEVLE